MFKNVFIALSAIALSFSTPAAAETVEIPQGFKVEPVNVGDIHAKPAANKAEVFITDATGAVFYVVFEGCTVDWDTNEKFYVIIVDTVGMFMTPATEFENILSWNGYDFKTAVNITIDNNKLCYISSIKKS